MERHCSNPPTMLGISQTSVRVLLVPGLEFYCPHPQPRGRWKIHQLTNSNQRQAGKIDLPSPVLMGRRVGKNIVTL